MTFYDDDIIDIADTHGIHYLTEEAVTTKWKTTPGLLTIEEFESKCLKETVKLYGHKALQYMRPYDAIRCITHLIEEGNYR